MNHLDFILTAYGAALIVVGALIAWVVLDFRAQRRSLADLERRGFYRRSEPSSGPATTEPAGGDA